MSREMLEEAINNLEQKAVSERVTLHNMHKQREIIEESIKIAEDKIETYKVMIGLLRTGLL